MLGNVKEIYIIDLQASKDHIVEYQFENQVSFKNNLEIEEITENTSLILNNYTDEEIEKIKEAVKTRVADANKDLAIKYLLENQLEEDIYVFPTGKIAYDDLVNQSEDLMQKEKTELQEQIVSIREQLQKIANEAITRFENKEYEEEEITTKFDAVKQEIEFATLDIDSTISVEDNNVIVEFNANKPIEIRVVINKEGQLDGWTYQYITYNPEEGEESE